MNTAYVFIYKQLKLSELILLQLLSKTNYFHFHTVYCTKYCIILSCQFLSTCFSALNVYKLKYNETKFCNNVV